MSNPLPVGQGQTTVVTTNAFNVTNTNIAAANILFTVNNVQNGYFELLGFPGVAITTFTLQAVINGEVAFVQDGSVNAPSYTVQVSIPGVTLAPQSLLTTLIPFQLTANQMSLNQGQPLALNASNFNATSFLSTPVNLEFVAGNVQQGTFTFQNGSGPLTRFSQSLLDEGQVFFTPDGTTNIPSCGISVGEVGLYLAPQTTQIRFNRAPVLIQNSLGINQGQTVVLTSNNLSASDPDDAASTLVFTVSGVQHGQFSLVTQPTIPLTSFLQSQITAGQIQFTQDGSANTPAYSVTVSDGKMNGLNGPAASTIVFNPQLGFTNSQIFINQGQIVIVTSNNINAVDPNMSTSPANLEITVSDLQYGHFERAVAPGFAITTFTQQEINQGSIHFVPDGSNNSPTFTLQVSNGQITSPTRAVQISFNHAPLLGSNYLTIGQGATVMLTNQDLNATDVETPASQLLFTASNIQHGFFVDVTGTHVTSFLQQQIWDRSLNFTADGTFNSPSYDIAISDGNMTTTPQSALVNFIPEISSSNTTVQTGSNTVRNAIIGASISAAASLGVFALKTYLGRKAAKDLQKALDGDSSEVEKEQVAFYKNVIRPIATSVFDHVKTTGLLGYRSEQDTKRYIAAIGSIVGKLEQQGINVQLQKMEPGQRTLFINTITDEIRLQTNRGNCCANFFKAEVTPDLLRAKADLIVEKIIQAQRNAPASPRAGEKPQPLLASGYTEMEMMSVDGGHSPTW